MVRKLIVDGAIAIALLLTSFAYGALYCDNSLFTTDATDYLRAVDDGFWNNYFDARSRGLWGVISTFKQQPEVRSRIWDYLARQDDAAAKRHFHVPVGFYPNILVRAF